LPFSANKTVLRVSEDDIINRIFEDFQKQELVESLNGKTLILGTFEHGKSSLAISLIQGKPLLNDSDDRTQVMGLHIWNIKTGQSIAVVDVGGHSAYQQLAHLFVINRKFNLCIVAHNIMSSDYEGTSQWIIDVVTKSPLVKILLALTKVDELKRGFKERKKLCVDGIVTQLKKVQNFLEHHPEVSRSEPVRIMMKNLVEKIESEEVVFCVSCKDGRGLAELQKRVINHFEENKIQMPRQAHTLYLEFGLLGINKPVSNQPNESTDRNK
jgi:GTPase SAR1 family protein